jgi:carbamoyl-phosphate synthase small subunit
MTGKLILEDKTEFIGESFGAEKSMAGEVVFSTGMVGYPESFTDPSYLGQILILTYPMVGNYGVPEKKFWESKGIKVSGLVVSQYIDTPSHFQSQHTLGEWFKKEGLPILEIKDTRFLTQKIRTKGVMLGKIVIDKDVPLYDPDKDNLVARTSTKKVIVEQPRSHLNEGGTLTHLKTILLYDTGAKSNIARCLTKRGVKVITVPWDFDPFDKNVILNSFQDPVSNEILKQVQNGKLWFDGVLISNGPGNPKMADKTIAIIKKFLDKKIPTLGICLGNQLLALAAGGDTSKMKFGHRSQNQPAFLEGSERCYITTQNHGYHVSKIPPGFKAWFTNANDGTNEGIIHKSLPFMSVQFHPEANPGPVDAEWIFDFFLNKVKKGSSA